MLYSEKVMDHFHNPRNVGEIENASGVGEVGNPTCGDVMKIFLKVIILILKIVGCEVFKNKKFAQHTTNKFNYSKLKK